MSSTINIESKPAVHSFWMRVWGERFSKNWRVEYTRNSRKGRPVVKYYLKQARTPPVVKQFLP